MSDERPVMLSDGSQGIVRKIVPSDAEALTTALWELAPDSRMRRFFFDKTDLSEKELARLTNPDGVNHLAYGLAVEIEDELKPVSVARCFRDRSEDDLAEIAMVTADAWQGKGAGAELMNSLSNAALKVGIRRWSGQMFSDNFAMRRLLDRFARKIEERDLGSGIVEVVYEIVEPEGGFLSE